jgi:hypothetical protein
MPSRPTCLTSDLGEHKIRATRNAVIHVAGLDQPAGRCQLCGARYYLSQGSYWVQVPSA